MTNTRNSPYSRRHGLWTTLAAVLLAACSPAPEPSAPTAEQLVVERTTVDGVTTVRNLSGSRWGAPARLVEELSIGVADGDEATMFGYVSAVATDGELVYVADMQAPALRVFDLEGRHVRNLGGPGEGPGEYSFPAIIGVRPDRSVLLYDSSNLRLTTYDPEGAVASTWTYQAPGYFDGFHPLADGTVLIQWTEPQSDAELAEGTWDPQYGLAPLLEDGSLGRVRRPPDLGHDHADISVQAGGRMNSVMPSVLFFPLENWVVRSDGAIVVGVSDRYRFEVHASDGSVTAVERYWEPVPVPEEHLQHQVRLVEHLFRELEPGWRYDLEPPPRFHPAYDGLTTSVDGRAWLLRSVGSRRVSDCVDPADNVRAALNQRCWRNETIVDVFTPDGEYLGELHRPADLTFGAVYADGDTYLAAVEDEDGLVMVKRYRIEVDAGEKR